MFRSKTGRVGRSGIMASSSRLASVAEVSDSGSEHAPSQPACKRKLESQTQEPFADLKTRLLRPCPCLAARAKYNAKCYATTNQASCFAQFLDPAPWKRLMAWREAFVKLHKLDQDQLVPCLLCRRFLSVALPACLLLDPVCESFKLLQPNQPCTIHVMCKHLKF